MGNRINLDVDAVRGAVGRLLHLAAQAAGDLGVGSAITMAGFSTVSGLDGVGPTLVSSPLLRERPRSRAVLAN